MSMNKKATFELEGKTTGTEAFTKMGASIMSIDSALNSVERAYRYFNTAVSTATRFVTQFVEVGSQFEQFEVQFQTLLGSADLAKQRLDELFTFARKTPYELDTVVATAKSLEAYGIYSERYLRAAGDAAAAFGVQLQDAALAISQGMMGEMERLKMFGISSAQVAKKLGHEIDRSTQEGIKETADAIVSLFEDKAAGGMDMLSETLVGKISNLKDQWTKFKLEVSDAGVFETVSDIMGVILERFEQFAGAEGQEGAQAIGNLIADALWWAAESLATVVDDLNQVVGALMGKKGGVGKWLGQEAFYGAMQELYPGSLLAGVKIGGKYVMSGRQIGQAIWPPTQFAEPLGLASTIRGAHGRYERRGLEQAMTPYAEALGIAPDWWSAEAAIAQAGAGVSYAPVAKPGVKEVNPYAAEEAKVAWQNAFMQEMFAGKTYGQAQKPGEIGTQNEAARLLRADMSDYVDVLEEGKRAEQELAESSDEAWTRMVAGSRMAMAGYETFFDQTGKLGQKWALTQKITMRDVANVMRESMRAAAVEWLAVEARKAGIEALKEGAKAIGAVATGQFGEAAAHTAAAFKWVAVAAAAGVAAGYVSAAGTGTKEKGSAGGGGEESVSADGTRAISRSTGVRTQELNIYVNISNIGPTVYGPGGWQELMNVVVIPAVREAIAVGDI